MPAAIFRWPKWTPRPRSPKTGCSAGRASSRSIPASARRRRRPGCSRGRRRRHPVRVRRLARAQVGEPDPRRSARRHGRHSRRRCRGARAGSRSADRQADPDQAFGGRSRRARRQGARGGGAHRQGARRHRHLRRPAAARRRLGDRGRPRQGGAIRHQPDFGRNGGAACHQRSEADGVPAGRRRQGRRHPAAPAGGPAHAVDARRAPGADRARVGADLELRRPQGEAERRHPQPHRRRAHGGGAGQCRRRRPGRGRAGRRSPRPSPT